ncbi:MAG: VOC family protein, partial [Bacillota bacterium]
MSRMVGDLRYTMIETKDLARAKAFYTEKLGLKLTAEGEGWISLAAGNQSMVIWSGENPSVIMGFVNPELDAIRSTLLSRGVQAAEIQEHPGGK